MMISVVDMEQNIAGKGENAGWLPQCFQKLFSCMAEKKTRDCLGKGYLMSIFLPH